jgi:hypothetical protein
MSAEKAIEFANQLFGDPTIQRSGRFSANEVRKILTLTHSRDLRQLGCPDAIFDKGIERRAKALGIEPEGEPEDLRARFEISKTTSAV